MADKEKTTWHKTTTEMLAEYGEGPDDCDACEIKFVDYQLYVLRLCPMHTAAQAMYEAMIIRQNFEKYSMGESFWPEHWGHAEIARYCRLVIATEKAALALVDKETLSKEISESPEVSGA